jgi:hypothetical protein
MHIGNEAQHVRGIFQFHYLIEQKSLKIGKKWKRFWIIHSTVNFELHKKNISSF